jgi:hypothetical protein
MFPVFKCIFELLNASPTEQSCIDQIKRLGWNGNPVFPFDATSKIYKCAGNEYRGKYTGKYFNVRISSIFVTCRHVLLKLQVELNRLMSMEDWSNRLDAFLKFNEHKF